MAPSDDHSGLETLRTADLAWLIRLTLSSPATPWDELPRSSAARIADVYWHLLQFLATATHHEGVPGLEARIAGEFADRVGEVAKRTLVARGLVRMLWRLHTPRSWMIRRLKESIAENGIPRPLAAAACSLEQSRGQMTLRRLPFCVRACDLRFFREQLELSYAEVGFVFGIPKSSVLKYEATCQLPRRGPGAAPRNRPRGDVGPEQAREYWDLLRGVGLRSAASPPVSLWLEVKDALRCLWLRLR